jgi:hypothetical protein
MIICPECKNECSAQATACPNCGHPFVQDMETVVVTPKLRPEPVIVAAAPRQKSDGFPAWAFVPIALALVLVIFGFIWLAQRNPNNTEENTNVHTRQTTAVNSNRVATTTVVEPPTVTNNPPAGASSTVMTPPTTTNVSSSSATTNLPPASGVTANPSASPINAVPDKSNLSVTATLTGSRGGKKPVTREKLYLLSKDLNEIFRQAGLEATEGDFTTTLGAAVADPSRKEQLNKMLAAVKPYIVASTLTDANGKAAFKDVKPSSYYLFAVHKTGNSANVWNESITLNSGENTITLNAAEPDNTNSSQTPPNFD